MAVLKSASFQPMAKDAVVLDLGDIGAQADRIIAAAEQRAQRIEAEAIERSLADAQEAADEAREKAHAEGYATGHASGLADGLEEGRKSGRDEAFNDLAPRLSAIETGLVDVAQRLDATRCELEQEARHAVLELAMRLAERIVHRVIETDRNVIVEQVGEVLSHVLGRYDVTLLVHPDDAPLLAEVMPDLARKFPDLQHIKLIEDDTIGVGGCIARYGQGEVDATIDTQLRRIVELLLPDVHDDASESQSEAKP